MIKAIMKIHTTSSSVTFVCGDAAIIGNGEFRASSGKVDGFIEALTGGTGKFEVPVSALCIEP